MITTKLVKVIWWIAFIVAALSLLAGLISLFSASSSIGLFMALIMLFAPVLWLLFVRIVLESVVVLFKIADNTAITAANTTPPQTQISAEHYGPPLTRG